MSLQRNHWSRFLSLHMRRFGLRSVPLCLFFCSFSSTGHFTAALSLFIVFLWLLEVCDLYCGGGADTDKWDEAQIGHYIGVGCCCVLICDSWASSLSVLFLWFVLYLSRHFVFWYYRSSWDLGEPEEALYCGVLWVGPFCCEFFWSLFSYYLIDACSFSFLLLD